MKNVTVLHKCRVVTIVHFFKACTKAKCGIRGDISFMSIDVKVMAYVTLRQ